MSSVIKACIVSVSLAAILTACGGAGSSAPPPQAQVPPPPPVAGYKEPTQAEINAIIQSWQSRDLSPRDVEVVHVDATSPLYELRVIRHTVGGETHYGVVTLPKNPDNARPPVIVELDGLDISLPPLDVGQKLRDNQQAAAQTVLIYPVHYGRTLRVPGGDWRSTGNWCNAFEGAADTTIALMNVVETTVPQADFSRVMVHGISRGGGVALLLGVRDPRVSVVVAAAAPVDFNRSDSANRYNRLYSCYFNVNATPEQAVQRMVASSALYFPMQPNVTKVWLDHGNADNTVPVWHSSEMHTRMTQRATTPVDLKLYPGVQHNIWDVAAYWERVAGIFNAFVAVPDTSDSLSALP